MLVLRLDKSYLPLKSHLIELKRTDQSNLHKSKLDNKLHKLSMHKVCAQSSIFSVRHTRIPWKLSRLFPTSQRPWLPGKPSMLSHQQQVHPLRIVDQLFQETRDPTSLEMLKLKLLRKKLCLRQILLTFAIWELKPAQSSPWDKITWSIWTREATLLEPLLIWLRILKSKRTDLHRGKCSRSFWQLQDSKREN